MRTLTSEEEQYISTVVRNSQKSGRIMGSIMTTISLYAFFSYFVADSSQALNSSGSIGSIVIIGGLLLMGINMLISNFIPQQTGKVEQLSGRYTSRRRRVHKIGNELVTIPPAWMGYFKYREEYAVEGIRIRNVVGFGKQFIVLNVQGMPVGEAKLNLNEMLVAKKFLGSIRLKALLAFAIIVGIPIAILYWLLGNVEASKSVGNWLLSASQSELIMYGVIGLLGLIVVLVIAFRFVYGQGKNSFPPLDPSFSSKEWLVTYKDFMEKQMMPMMKNEERNPELFMRIKDIMTKNKRYKSEYKQLKNRLYGSEKDDFVREFKSIVRNGRSI